MNKDFAKKADLYIPKIHKSEILYKSAVKITEDLNFYQDTAVLPVSEKEYYLPGDKICLDFGRHVTGYFYFEMGQYKKYLDAPVKLKIKFGETPYEIRRDFSSYTPGLCESWLQEEIINIDIKGRVELPRRYSFRYVEISVIAAPKEITLSGFTAVSCSAIDRSSYDSSDVSEDFRKIDEISANTLAECMQDFFEDGPKRDRRLWIGDLRLEALANYHTFKNIDIVKRCLYLFAAFDSEDTLLPAYVYTKPELEEGEAHLVSYALLYAVTLCDYFEYTGDEETVLDLFAVAKHQIDICSRSLDENGILVAEEGCGWWSFIDWADKLEPFTPTMGIYIYTVNCFSELCGKLGKTAECEKYREFAEQLKSAALKHLYNGEAFVNSYDKNQYTSHSQVWMILAGVINGDEAQKLLKKCLEDEKYLAPATPYMHHYVAEAYFKCGMAEEAKQYIKDYWGEMVALGADTFWEVFVKGEPFKTPYIDPLINSACHAWSCTPSYFIRKYDLSVK